MRKQTNRFSSQMYKKGGEKQDWISNKISTLLKEDPNMPQKQAIAIALSMSEKQFQDGGTPKKPLFGAESMFPISRVDKNVNGDYTINYTNSQIEPATYSKQDFEAKLKLTQPSADAPGQYDPYLLKYMKKTQGRTGQTVTYADGGAYNFNPLSNFGNIEQPKMQGFGYDPNYQNQLSVTSMTAGEDFKKANPLPTGIFEADPFGVSSNKELDTSKKTIENFQPMQFFNPYAGVDLAQGANALGQSIENKDALGIVAGGAKVLAGTARNIFGGMGQANIRNEGIKNYMDAQRDNIVGKSQQGENGGRFPNFQVGGEAIYPMEEPTPYESFPNGVYEAPTQQFPTGIYQAPEITPPPSFDTNSARDTWVQKTGMPWSEAKKLGYTDGSAKDNKKLLSELNDPKFKKEYLRTEPIQKVTKTEAKKIIPKAEATPQLKKESNSSASEEFGKKIANNYKNYKGNAKVTATKDKSIGDYIEQGVEYAGNPGQTFAHYGKYGELPAKGFTKNGRTDGFDDILGRINPFKWFSAGFNALDAAENKDYATAGKEALNAAGALSKLKYVKYVPLNKALPAARTPAAQAIGQGARRLNVPSRPRIYQDGGEQQDPLQMVSEALQQGATEEQIAQMLMQQGYSEEEVGQIFQQLQGQQSFQEGGEQQGQAEQIYQMVAEALQSGADPQQIAQQLISSGIPEEQVMQIIQEVMSQMQGMQQSPQEEQIEGSMSNPQEEATEMKMGGSFMDEIIGKKILGYKYNKDKDSYTLNYE